MLMIKTQHIMNKSR